MELWREWQVRINNWIKTVSNDIFTPVTTLDCEAFITNEHLTYEEALKGDFKPIENGAKWGKTWEYMWVKTVAEIPEKLENKNIYMDLAVGGEACVWVNGEEFGCRRNEWVRNRVHHFCDLELVPCGKAGEKFEILLEVYAGHSHPFDNMPIIDGKRPVDPAKTETHDRATFNGVILGEWDEDAYQLYLDANWLNESLKVIPEDTLRYDDIRDALKKFTTEIDFAANKKERHEAYIRAREILRPAMECKNGTCAPVMYAFGHAHIDVAWLWPLSETERKVMRTFAAQLRHMDRYPDYKFIQSQAHLYRYVKKYYPKMFERIKEKVKKGQWIPEGGMWVEADTNVASGEALIRQFIHGKRFFMEELGYDSRMLWLPDVFGYNAALPEIMKGCDIDYFCTQKLTWAYNGGEPFPLNYFNWIGLDGTKLPTFVHGNYNSETDPLCTANLWKNRKQRKGLRGFVMPFGYGDGGGGPPRDYIENVIRCKDYQGMPRVEMKHPNDYFIDNPEPEESYVGELYLQCHRGTLTSQAKTKKGNRKSELSLRETEFWGQIAKFSGFDYPLKEMDELWKKVLLNQFHDILPGSSINRVYKEAEEAYSEILKESARIRREAMAHLLEKDGITVTNSLSFPRRALVKLPEGYTGVCDEDGELPVQAIGDSKYAYVNLPACGTVTLNKAEEVKSDATVTAYVTEGGAVMENSVMKVEFNSQGAISSIFDKVNSRKLSKGLCNDFKMYRDDPIRYDAWDVDSTYEFCPVELNEKAEFEVIATNGFVSKLKITRNIANSKIVQTAILVENERRMDFETNVDWKETHKLLKVCFDTDMVCDNALNEIQFGYVKRPNHRSRQYDMDRFEVANYRYTALAESGRGFAVINDCKYGVNQLMGSINLTLLRSATSPDPECDYGEHSFTYGFVAYDGAFSDAEVIRAAADLNCPAETYEGSFGDGSLIAIEGTSIQLESLKPAEDGSGDYIIRLYEATGSGTNALLTLGIPCSEASYCKMTETVTEPAQFDTDKDGITVIPLSFGAFEIKTLRIKP